MPDAQHTNTDAQSAWQPPTLNAKGPEVGLTERLAARLEFCKNFPLIPVVDASTDPGDDNDDILKVVASAYFQLTTMNQVASVIERAPVKERALLAQGTMDTLGLKGVELAVGSHYSYGSGPMHELAQSMMANRDQTFVRSTRLFKSVLEAAHPRSLTLLCIGGLKDLCETVFLEPTLIQEKVCQTIFMGGVVTLKERLLDVEPGFKSEPLPTDLNDRVYKLAFGRNWRRLHHTVTGVDSFEHAVYLDEQGRMTADPRAANNKFDYNSASSVYTAMQAWRIPMVIYTRHAAEAMTFPRAFYDELAASTGNPVAEYLRDFQRDILQKLWWRTWQTGLDRESLPTPCTPQWFGKKFCDDPTLADRLTQDQDPWNSVKRFAPYDVGTFFAADPRLRIALYDPEPVVVGGQTHQVIGISPQKNGIKDSQGATQFFMDTIRGGFTKAAETVGRR